MRSLSGAFWLAGAVIGAAPACAQLPDIILSGVAIKATPSLSIVSDPGRPVWGRGSRARTLCSSHTAAVRRQNHHPAYRESGSG